MELYRAVHVCRIKIPCENLWYSAIIFFHVFSYYIIVAVRMCATNNSGPKNKNKFKKLDTATNKVSQFLSVV